MKSIFGDLNKTGNKYWNAIQISVLVAIFVYIFAENFVLSESWEVLSLRSIDDYAIQDSIRSMQKALIAGNWSRVFGFFDYAYGDAFWLFNAILMLPLYFIDNAQLLIVAGRQISLVFVFLSIYVVNLIIDRIRPDAGPIKYAVLISIATMPMTTIIATKYHVNAQSIFLGLLSLFLLVRDQTLTKKSQVWSALFAGMAVGFKLTSILMVPLLVLVLLTKLRKQSGVNSARRVLVYAAIFILTAAACTAPRLLLFPFYTSELSATYKTFVLFKNMASTEAFATATLITDGLGFYLSPWALTAILFLFVILAADEIKNRHYITLYIFTVIVISTIILVVAVDKAPIYIASYLISIAFLLPLGLLGISIIKTSNTVKMSVVYAIIIGGLIYGNVYRNQVLSSYKFFEIAKSERIVRQFHALDEMRLVVSPLKLPVRILQDATSIFPATRFTEGVDVAINYGDLKEKSTWGTFDYILLDSKDYYGKRPQVVVHNRKFSPQELASELEEATRRTLYEDGEFYGRKYQLIYQGYDALLYKLVSK
jgi:hypothetical protein